MTTFDALTLALEDWFATPLSELPEALRRRVEKEFAPMPWDQLSAEGRRSVLLQLDYQHDPTTEQDRQFWWDFYEHQTKLKAQIAQWEAAAAPTAGEMALRESRLKELRQELARTKVQERQARGDYYPERKSLDGASETSPVSQRSALQYVAYPKAMAQLRKRLDATPEELAAWIFTGPKDGGIAAYVNANELDPPPRFHFGLGSGKGDDHDYVSPLMACWFQEDEIAGFNPTIRYITGEALIKRWAERPGLRADAWVRAKIRESRLSDLHPLYGGTQGTWPDDEAMPLMTTGLFRVSDVEAIEAEDFGWDREPQTMATHNADNERIKRRYFVFLKEAKRQSEDSVDAVAKALARFEADTRYRDFKAFHFEQAVAFKKRLADQDSLTTGGKLSKATLHATLAHLKRFFEWLAGQPGYKSRLQYSDAEYFGLSLKDARVATARRAKPVPTLEQIRHTIALMPSQTEIERRNRALMSFALLTGARDSAIASMKLKHVDLAAGSVFQDARDVKTKYSKTFPTYFMNVGDDVRQIFDAWVTYLLQEKLWGNDDPLFPATLVELGESRQFEAVGLARRHWRTASPIRTIFQCAFEAAGLPYFNPHSFRNTLVQLGQALCRDAEQFKSWSQNMGHDGVLTTFLSYGTVEPRRQGQIIQALGLPGGQPTGQAEVVAQAVVQAMRGAGLLSQHG